MAKPIILFECEYFEIFIIITEQETTTFTGLYGNFARNSHFREKTGFFFPLMIRNVNNY